MPPRPGSVIARGPGGAAGAPGCAFATLGRGSAVAVTKRRPAVTPARYEAALTPKPPPPPPPPASRCGRPSPSSRPEFVWFIPVKAQREFGTDGNGGAAAGATRGPPGRQTTVSNGSGDRGVGDDPSPRSALTSGASGGPGLPPTGTRWVRLEPGLRRAPPREAQIPAAAASLPRRLQPGGAAHSRGAAGARRRELLPAGPGHPRVCGFQELHRPLREPWELPWDATSPEAWPWCLTGRDWTGGVSRRLCIRHRDSSGHWTRPDSGIAPGGLGL